MPGVAPTHWVSSEYIAFWGVCKRAAQAIKSVDGEWGRSGDVKDTRDESALAKVDTHLKGNSKESLSGAIGCADRSFLPQELTGER